MYTIGPINYGPPYYLWKPIQPSLGLERSGGVRQAARGCMGCKMSPTPKDLTDSLSKELRIIDHNISPTRASRSPASL